MAQSGGSSRAAYGRDSNPVGGAATGQHHDLLVAAAARAQRAGDAAAERRRALAAIECTRGSKRTAARLRAGRHETIPWHAMRHATYNMTPDMRGPPTFRACETGDTRGREGVGE